MLFVRKKFKNIQKELPSIVKLEVNKLDDVSKEAFTEEYLKRRKGLDWCYLFVFIFFTHRLYLNQTGMFIFQWLLVLLGGIGLIWVLIDFVLIPSMVKKRNGEIAKEVLMQHNAMVAG